MSLPLLISVPHAGTQVPSEVVNSNLLTKEQIIKDGDERAREIYAFRDKVAAYVTTDIARAFVDMNRSDNDLSPDGVVKTETIYKEKIFSKPLQTKQIIQLLTRYYFPYHKKLSRLSHGVILGIDCHTMAAVAPPISDEPGVTRPFICLSDAGSTCPEYWTLLMADCLEREFGFEVSINTPFKGGHIIRSHASELPWLQLELSRAEFMSVNEKRKKIYAALKSWCQKAEPSKVTEKE